MPQQHARWIFEAVAPEARNLRLLRSVAPLAIRHWADDQTLIRRRRPTEIWWPFLASEDRGPVCGCVCVDLWICLCTWQSGLPEESRVGSDSAACDQTSPLALCPSPPDSAKAKQAGYPLQGQIVSDPVDTKATQARSVARVFRWPVQCRCQWLERLGPARVLLLAPAGHLASRRS